MSYCPKCGNKVDETMTFCPRCGTSLKMEPSVQGVPPAPSAPTPPPYYRNEKQEKGEKQEKQHGEKHEKGEFGFIGWLIGGLIIIFIGLISYLNVTVWHISGAQASALWLLVIGILIIIAGVYFGMRARSRTPRPT